MRIDNVIAQTKYKYMVKEVSLNKKYTDLFLASQLDESHETDEMTEFVENYTQEL